MVLSLCVATLALSAAAGDSGGAGRDSAEVVSPRVVRRLAEIVVRAQFHDPLSSESAHLIPGFVLSTLPVSRLNEAIALKAGVVARGEQLNVRGGRPGETIFMLRGVSLHEPLRSRPIEIPLLAIRDVELLTGGLDAEYGGALAGVVKLRTVEPGQRYQGALSWQTDGRAFTHYDRVAGRVSGPIHAFGLGAVVAAEALLDDTHLPNLRTKQRTHIGGGAFGWRSANRLLGYAKLAPLRAPSMALEVVVNRRVDQPFNPMFSLNGYTTPCADPSAECQEPAYSPIPLPGYSFYRAADHAVMTDEHRAAALWSWTRPSPWGIAAASAAWIGARRLVSVGGRDDESYLAGSHAPVFGRDDSPYNEPFFVYLGDEPFFQRSTSQSLAARIDFERVTARGNRAKVGLGTTYESVRLRDLDASTHGTGFDSLRSYRAFAPGMFAYGQGRWLFEGLVLNAGLRAEYFTAGPQAEDQAFAGTPRGGIWSFSPRAGVAYPVSERDVFSLAYVRIQQNPARDFLYENRRQQISHRQQLGNPQLEPATMISYQVGVKHSFSQAWSLQGAIFYRDLFGLVGTREFRPESSPILRPRYENADEGHAEGFELSVVAAEGDRAHGELHYTYMHAWGTQSLEEGVPFGSHYGERLPLIGEHPLDWDRRHTLVFTGWLKGPLFTSLSWSTLVGSGLPWTPRARRVPDADNSQLNSRRFKWEEWTSVRAEWNPRRGPLRVGLEARNLFDRRNDVRATVLGYPHPLINTYYDDYGAFRTETGLGGGAYWNDMNGDGLPGWRRVHDPRLVGPRRVILMSLGVAW